MTKVTQAFFFFFSLILFVVESERAVAGSPDHFLFMLCDLSVSGCLFVPPG